MENFSEQNELLYLEAKRKVKKRKAFFVHLAIFLMVIAIAVLITLTGAKVNMYDFFTLGIWGVFLLLQGLRTFLPDFFLGDQWEEKKILEIMNKNK